MCLQRVAEPIHHVNIVLRLSLGTTLSEIAQLKLKIQLQLQYNFTEIGPDKQKISTAVRGRRSNWADRQEKLRKRKKGCLQVGSAEKHGCKLLQPPRKPGGTGGPHEVAAECLCSLTPERDGTDCGCIDMWTRTKPLKTEAWFSEGLYSNGYSQLMLAQAATT